MRLTAAASLLLACVLFSSPTAQAQRFIETDLVSDIADRAAQTDANLVNPWGLVPGPSGTFWVADNGPGLSTLYNPAGAIQSLVVTIPGGKPTGIAVTSAGDSAFAIPSADTTARAIFIFVTENGIIAAWSPSVNQTAAIQVAATSGAIYKGIALAGTGSGPRLYAANFHAGTIDVFNRSFLPISLSGAFSDPNLPSGYGPFNIANIGGELYVAYAQQDANQEDEVAGAGLGVINIFDLDGHLVRRLTAGVPLNAPWAMVQAPAGFGNFGGALLVGNFGDGKINAFDRTTGGFLGALTDTLGNPIAIDGLWGLHFGLPVSGSQVAGRLYFAAGLQDEAHGLFGYVAPAGVVGGPGVVACGSGAKGLGLWRRDCGGPRHESQDGSHRGSDNGPRGEGHLGNRHGPPSGTPSDSLDALFGCATADLDAFGASGCFTAGCDLLSKVGRRSVRERAAQQLLALKLNLCAGLLCDTLVIRCSGEVEDRNGDDEQDGARLPVLTVGQVVTSLDSILCQGGTDGTIRSLSALAACASHSGEDGDEEGGEETRLPATKLEVTTLGSSPIRLSSTPIRFELTATEPAMVRLRIYDAAGRLVAEPLRNAAVAGQVEVHWDGRNLNGNLVAPGTYFYRATGANATSSGRIIIVH